jgi:hypothetical protein
LGGSAALRWPALLLLRLLLGSRAARRRGRISLRQGRRQERHDAGVAVGGGDLDGLLLAAVVSDVLWGRPVG